MKRFPSYFFLVLITLTMSLELCGKEGDAQAKNKVLALDADRLARLGGTQNVKELEPVAKIEQNERLESLQESRASRREQDASNDDSDLFSREELDRLLSPRKEKRSKYSDELSSAEMIKYGIGALLAFGVLSGIIYRQHDFMISAQLPYVGTVAQVGVNAAPLIQVTQAAFEGAKNVVSALPNQQKTVATDAVTFGTSMLPVIVASYAAQVPLKTFGLRASGHLLMASNMLILAGYAYSGYMLLNSFGVFDFFRGASNNQPSLPPAA